VATCGPREWFNAPYVAGPGPSARGGTCLSRWPHLARRTNAPCSTPAIWDTHAIRSRQSPVTCTRTIFLCFAAQVIHFKDHLKIPSYARLHSSTVDVIMRLCCDQHNRLGSRSGAEEVKQHEFFAGIDWNILRQINAPYIPEVSGWGEYRRRQRAAPRRDLVAGRVFGSCNGSAVSLK